MEDNKGFVYAYGWNAYYQKILGYRSEKNESLIARHRAWFWGFMIFLFIYIPKTATLPFLWGDLNAVIDSLATNMSMGISIMKIFVLQYQRKALGEVLDSISIDWATPRKKEEIEIMLESAKISRFISIISFALTNLMFFEYAVSQNVMQDSIVENDPRLTFSLFHVAYFPFDLTNSMIFVPLWISQFLTTYVSMMGYGGPDCLVSMLVLHLCGQIKIVRHALKDIVHETTVREPKLFWRQIKATVERHEQLNEIASVVRDTFSSILLVQMLICSMTFCFEGYILFTTLLDRDGASIPILDLGFSIIYSTFTITHLFMHCYVGDKLLVESTSIADDFYESEWYNLSPKEAKVFLFVSNRSNIPLEIKAGKFCTFNLELFNSVLKTSMGYLSMLMAMKERLID